MIAANTTPTFGFFVTAESALPFFPSHVRAFVRFRDSTGNVRGSTSIALTTLPALSPGQTAGGFYIGVFRITSGRLLGASGMTKFLISEDGEARGVSYTNQNTIDALFYGMANLDTSLLYVSSGTVLAANGFILDNGTTVSRSVLSERFRRTAFWQGSTPCRTRLANIMPNTTAPSTSNPRHWPRSQAVGLSEI
jgi:hypothetical protein